MADPTVLDDSARAIPSEREEGLAIPAWVAMVGFLLLVAGGHVALHHRLHGTFNVHQIVMALFLALNLLVNFWELGLYFTADAIRDEYLRTKDAYAGRPMDRCNEVFLMRVPLARLFSFKSWTGIWSSYCHFDPGYSRKGSFGYNIDVGNGFSTVIPATLFGLGMSLEIVSPRVLGMIGIATFWQMFYGTVVYFFQFFNAGRHIGHAKKDLWIFVGTTNGMWFIFPLWGMALSAAMVMSGTFDVFR